LAGQRHGPRASFGARRCSWSLAAATTCRIGSGNINCPTLVAFGEFDALAPPTNSEAIASRIAGSELRGYQAATVSSGRTADIVGYLSAI